MAIDAKRVFVDASTKQEVELVKCACENEVFFITTTGQQFCSCCMLTMDEAVAAKSKSDAAKV